MTDAALQSSAPPKGRLGGADVAVFLATAFGFSWLVAFGIWRAGWMSPASPNLPLATAALAVFMWGPAIAAVACALMFDKGRRLEALGLALPFNGWLIAAWLAPIAIAALALALTLAASGRDYQPISVAIEQALVQAGQDPATLPLSMETIAAIQLVSAFTIGPLINWPLLLSEELGWRGWLWDRWSRLGFWRNVLATGVIWGLWHAPIIALGHNYPGMPVAGPFLMILFTVLLCPALHLIRERGGTVWHAALFHGTINAVAGLTIVLLADSSMPWRGIVGLGGFLALLLASAVVLLVRRRAPASARASA